MAFDVSGIFFPGWIFRKEEGAVFDGNEPGEAIDYPGSGHVPHLSALNRHEPYLPDI